MIADVQNLENGCVARISFSLQASQNQHPPSGSYQFDLRASSRLNGPAKNLGLPVKFKQVLPGKALANHSVADEFQSLVKQWKEETYPLSSLTKIYAHPAYQRIMAMGSDGLPFVLRELKNNQGHWFYALKFMAGKNISAGMNDFEEAKGAWLEWGYKNNYI
jgi:hypothetical protein